MKITEALAAEHTILLGMFDQIERALPAITAVGELKAMAGIIEGMLREHGDKETNLAYAALDHLLADKGKLNRMHQDHKELDGRLKLVYTAKTPTKARQLLLDVIVATREHFQCEERLLFPLLEEAMQVETLVKLGQAWMQRPASSPPSVSAN
jgi:hypothetical protein